MICSRGKAKVTTITGTLVDSDSNALRHEAGTDWASKFGRFHKDSLSRFITYLLTTIKDSV